MEKTMLKTLISQADNNGLNVLSLFDGISCGRIALERAGIKVNKYFASEIEPSAIKISQKNYPDIIQLGDVKNVSIFNLPKIDLVIGGSPCQGFSRNGKGLNFEDSRSKLFFEYVRLLNDIRKTNPDVLFLLENVRMKNEWVEVINNYLGVKGVLINSKYFSAQNRERMYWTNIPVLSYQDKNIKLLDVLEKYISTNNYIYKEGLLFDSTLNISCVNLVYVKNNEIRITQATKQGYIVAADGDGINLEFPNSKTRRGRVIKNKSHTLDRGCNICVLTNNIIRRLSLIELERLQTLPDNYTKGVSDTARKSAIGNGWTVDVITHIFTGIKVKK